MKNVFKIYKRDLKNIFTNWVALIVTLALVILPPLYAWFNIKSSWDPYGSTSGIKVAVVNEDKGTKFKEQEFNIGNEIINKLKNNKDIGWKFVNKKEADAGVKNGTYYASIVIPKDFSEKTLSITSDEIKKPVLEYTVNEKINAIAPKITDKGVSSIQSQVSSQIVSTVDGIIFKVLNTAGIEFEGARPQLRDSIDKVYKLNDNMPEIYNLLLKANDGAITIEELVTKVNALMPTIEDTINSSQDLLTSVKGYLEKGDEVFKDVSPTIKEDLIILQGITNSVNNIMNSIDTASSKEELLVALNNAQGKLTNINNSIVNINNFIVNLNNIFNNEVLTNLSAKLVEIQGKINSSLELINSSINDINSGNDVAFQKFEDIKKLSNDINNAVTDINSRFDTEIVPAINNGIESMNKITDNSLTILNEAEGSLPDVKKVLSLLDEGSTLGNEKLSILIKDFPQMQEKLGNFVSKIKEFDNDEQIDEILDLIINDWQSSSNYLASPIEINSKSIFSVPNYGSGMSPFFTTLSLWVGGLLLVSLFTTKAKENESIADIKPLQEYFGKYLTFISIGAMQGLIVTLGDIYILKTYVVHPALFVLYGIFISMVFITIIYTLVSVLGNVGKAIAVIFLVLQISASGGTFPVEVMPKFFQHIHPLLPFKYAIGAMREVVAGIVPEVLIKDTLYLAAYLAGFMLLGVLFKSFANNKLEVFSRKLKESELIDH